MQGLIPPATSCVVYAVVEGAALPSHDLFALVRRGRSWAADAGDADQAHLARDCADLAGETPTAWRQRMAALDPRMRGTEDRHEA